MLKANVFCGFSGLEFYANYGFYSICNFFDQIFKKVIVMIYYHELVEFCISFCESEYISCMQLKNQKENKNNI